MSTGSSRNVRFTLPHGIRATPHNPSGEMALRIYAAALKAVRADTLINSSLKLDQGRLTVQGDVVELSRFRRILVVGAGKATAGMAAALEAVMGEWISGGVVSTKHFHTVPTQRIRVLEAGHPLPDMDSVGAGSQILSLARSAGADDLVICLLSGGASALMEQPVNGVSLEDLRVTTDLLQRAGADIVQLNAVRRRLSRIKAGGLARALHPATVICLVISDVLGNRLSVIGSGPCIDEWARVDSAARVASGLDVMEHLPESVRGVLVEERSIGSEPRAPIPHYILGDVSTAIDSCRAEALRLGLRPIVMTTNLTGEASDAGRAIAMLAIKLGDGRMFDCILAGGETTVSVRGTGKGGRAQELTAAASEHLPTDAALLSAGTDGTDGPTDAAGGLVDQMTPVRAGSRGIPIREALSNNNTYELLRVSESLIVTGPTQSNVNDLVILARA